VWIDQGDVPGDPLRPSDEIVIPVYTDTTLLGLDVTLTLVGPGTIVGALDKATAASYGWDPGFTFDPTLPGAAVEIGAGNFSGAPGPVVGFYLIHCDDYGPVLRCWDLAAWLCCVVVNKTPLRLSSIVNERQVILTCLFFMCAAQVRRIARGKVGKITPAIVPERLLVIGVSAGSAGAWESRKVV
jgi:hypothetical protein